MNSFYPKSLEEVIESFKKLPGVGEKSAERYALSLLEVSEEELESFSKSIKKLKKKLKNCKICGHLTEGDICDVCSNASRDKKTICVLEDYKSVFAFEKVGNYKGSYHVLNGLISPIDKIDPADLNITTLIKRVEETPDCEVIIALNSTIEGEMTTLYLKKILEDKKVTVSRLSYGISMGAEIDYLDPISLDKALGDRKKF
jgi:recombination protein RecR